MKVSKILANVIPRIKPVADARWYSRVHQEFQPGPVFLWELEWMNSTWYIWDTKGKSFIYKKFIPKVRKFGKYYFWKGTYKY